MIVSLLSQYLTLNIPNTCNLIYDSHRTFSFSSRAIKDFDI